MGDDELPDRGLAHALTVRQPPSPIAMPKRTMMFDQELGATGTSVPLNLSLNVPLPSRL